MRNMNLPRPLADLPRRVLATVMAAALVVGGGLATVASSEAPVPLVDPSASTSTIASQEAAATSTAAPSSAPAPTATSVPAGAEAQGEAVTFTDNAGGAGGNNLVMINNFQDDSLRIRGSVQLNRINAPNVAPQNLAQALAFCADCETLAVAMQINLIKRGTHRVVPGNAAVAVNAGCSGCTTGAIALQYVLSVDDPMETPREVRALARAMDSELRRISRTAQTLEEAIARIDSVVADFRVLAESLRQTRDIDTTPTSADATQTSEPSQTITASPEPAASASPEATPDASQPSDSPIPSPSLSPTSLPSDSPTPSASASP